MEIAIWWKLSFDQTICPIFGELTSEEQQIAIFHLLPRNVNPLISLPLHNRYKWRWRWDITLSLINNTLDTFMLAQELRPLVLQILQHPPESNKKIQNMLWCWYSEYEAMPLTSLWGARWRRRWWRPGRGRGGRRGRGGPSSISAPSWIIHSVDMADIDC